MNTTKWRNIIIQGWSGMLFLIIFMMLTDIIECGMKTDFTLLQSDPGINGLWFIVIVASVNVLVQISIKTFDGYYFRWGIFVLTIIYTLIFVAHQCIHLANGEGFDMHFVFDVIHHTLGIWATIAAFQWVKVKS